MTDNKTISAVIFDMDGVVIDTRKPIEDFWRKIAKEHDIVITTETIEQHIHGCPARQTVDFIFPDLSAKEREELFARCEHFETTMDYVAMSGVKELLTSLNKHNIPVALVTSSLPPKVANVIMQLRLEGMFNTIVTSDLVRRGKPDPACYTLAAEKLNIKAENCIVFEDAVSGVKASTAADMFTVGVGGEDQAPLLKQAGADEVIVNFENVQLQQKRDRLILQISPYLSLSVMAG